MMLNFKQKEEIICKFQEKFETALSIVVADMYGITSNSINQLRKIARASGVSINVIPNSLIRRVVSKMSCKCLSELFFGNSIVAFSTKKPSDAARIFLQFSKIYENFKIKGAFFENKLIKPDQINILAGLPEYKESIMRLMLVLKLNSIGKLINILKILSDKKVKS